MGKHPLDKDIDGFSKHTYYLSIDDASIRRAQVDPVWRAELAAERALYTEHDLIHDDARGRVYRRHSQMLIVPYTPDGDVDWDSLAALLEGAIDQLNAAVDESALDEWLGGETPPEDDPDNPA